MASNGSNVNVQKGSGRSESRKRAGVWTAFASSPSGPTLRLRAYLAREQHRRLAAISFSALPLSLNERPVFCAFPLAG